MDHHDVVLPGVGSTLRHLRPRAFDLVQCDAATFTHAAEDTVGHVEQLLRGVELLRRRELGPQGC